MIGFLIWALIVCVIAYVVVLLLGHLGAPPMITTLVWVIVALILLVQLLAIVGYADWPPLPRHR